MTDGYDEKSCNALQRQFYRPVEAALRWCNLTQHEGTILQSLGVDHIPGPGLFPQWPCLRANTEKILDAIEHGEIPYGRDGKAVPAGEHVAVARRTVRHTDLHAWMARHHPGSKPAFLLDEIERSAHAAINADSFRALQADRDAARAELEQACKRGNEIVSERDALLGERDSLRAMVDKMAAPVDSGELTTRERDSLLRILYGMACAAPYRYDSSAARNEATATIASATAAADCGVDADTVRKYLKEAAERFGTARRAGR
ncbi:MAG: hypothetical protein Q8M01_07230 [Rubrivivax sp.]|nr:hypothetical protein [Rubrivivax sp.]